MYKRLTALTEQLDGWVLSYLTIAYTLQKRQSAVWTSFDEIIQEAFYVYDHRQQKMVGSVYLKHATLNVQYDEEEDGQMQITLQRL